MFILGFVSGCLIRNIGLKFKYPNYNGDMYNYTQLFNPYTSTIKQIKIHVNGVKNPSDGAKPKTVKKSPKKRYDII